MKIVIVADTHSLEIPKQLLEESKGVDLIIHVGDFCSLKDLKVFQDITDVKAVFGNMDDKTLQTKLPEKDIFEIEGVKIGLFHGYGSARNVLSNVCKEFQKDKVDIVIFGHSHQPTHEIIEGVCYFNPGSPNDTITAPYCSYGMLEIKNGKFKVKTIKVKS